MESNYTRMCWRCRTKSDLFTFRAGVADAGGSGESNTHETDLSLFTVTAWYQSLKRLQPKWKTTHIQLQEIWNYIFIPSHLQQKPQWWAWTIVTDLGNSSLNMTKRLFSRFFPTCQFAVAHQPNFGDRVTYELIWFGYVNLVKVTNTQALFRIHTFPPLIRNMSMKKKSSFQWKSDEWWRTLTPQPREVPTAQCFSVYTSPL